MKKRSYIGWLTFFLVLLAGTNSQASTRTVINNNNSGAGSLRQAVLDAVDGDLINFAPNVKGSIRLASAIPIDKNLTIDGPGAYVLGIEGRDQPTEARVFSIFTAVVKISGLRISRGFSSGAGGGVLVSEGSLTLNNCLVSGNTAESGGGIFVGSGASLTLINSAINGNDSFVEGGGVSNRGGTLTMINSTIVDNESPLGGVAVDGAVATILNCTITKNGNTGGSSGDVGGLWINGSSTVNLKNTIVAGNIVSGTSTADVDGTVNSQGNNLIGNPTGGTGFISSDLVNVNPKLGNFANNGGATYTVSLLAGSPAINAGNNTGAPATDQRGVARPQSGIVDIGSYEFGVIPPSFGKIVFVKSGLSGDEIFSMNANGSNQVNLTNNTNFDSDPNWSPDGSKIVFVSDRATPGTNEIFSMNADGSNPTRLTNNSVADETPEWSPDGTRIAFASSGQIFVMDADGANKRQLTGSAFAGAKSHPSWSPAGTQIVFHNNRGFGNFGIYLIDSACLNCTGGQRLDHDPLPDNFNPIWSPDSISVAFSNDQNDLNDHSNPGTFLLSPFLANLSFPSHPLVVTNNPRAFSPAWSPDGTKLVYLPNAGGSFFVINADGSNPTSLGVSGNVSLPNWSGLNTPCGENITAITGTVSVAFGSVTAPCGTTAAVPIDPATAGALPGGYTLGAGLPAYEVTTTAGFIAPVTVCIQVPSVTSQAAFDLLRILHNEGGTLVDKTILSPDSPAPDFATKTICARVGSLSPFVVAKLSGGNTISGQLMYANGSTPAKNVTMTLTGPAGFSPRTTTTDSNGVYSFANVPVGGDYTVTPSKSGDVNGITAFDASLAARFAANLITLTPNQIVAADASGNGGITAFDASLIARTAANIPNTGIAGTWKFLPANLTVPNLSSDQNNQNVTAILVGDVSGNWIPN